MIVILNALFLTILDTSIMIFFKINFQKTRENNRKLLKIIL